MLAKPICLYVWKYEERCTVPKLLPSSLVAVGCSLPYTSYTGRTWKMASKHTLTLTDFYVVVINFFHVTCGMEQAGSVYRTTGRPLGEF